MPPNSALMGRFEDLRKVFKTKPTLENIELMLKCGNILLEDGCFVAFLAEGQFFRYCGSRQGAGI